MLEFCSIDGVTLEDKSINGDVMITNVTGLTGMPEIRGDTYDRADADGVVEPDFQFFKARVSAVDVLITGTSESAAYNTWITVSRALVGAFRAQKLLKWRVIGASLNMQAAVRVAGMTPPVYSSAGAKIAFQVLFRAADPNNYDQAATTAATTAPSLVASGLPLPIPFPIPWALVGSGAGTVSVTNNGDTDAWPAITITGPINNPTVQNQTRAQAIYLTGISMGSGDILYIDTNPAHRQVQLNGNDAFGDVVYSTSEFFAVSAGATEQITFSGSGTDNTLTTMTVSLRSAYIV